MSSPEPIQVPQNHKPAYHKDLYFLPIPKWLQHDPDHPPHFGLYLNILFGVASTFLVANLYYCQPLLIQLSHSFGVDYDEISRIPTLLQAGYATGLLLITPLGDLVRRRPLILLLTFVASMLTLGLPLTYSVQVFEALSYLVGVVTVVPQIMMPFAADLAPPERRAAALSIVLSGLLLGLLLARVLAGIIAEFASWRIVYWVAFGAQMSVFTLLYFMLPDYPARNTGLTYWRILYTMGKFTVTEPQLIQAALVNIASMMCFTNFWVTLTFLLGGEPYNYSTLTIGLFGLVGIVGVAAAPFIGRLVDRLVPWFATVVATIGLIVFSAIQTGAGGINIAAVVIVCFGLDVSRQMQQVSLTSAVFGLEPNARSRLNAVLIISIFIGQIVGTAVGTYVFNKHGWRVAAALSVGWTGFCLIVMLIRGPHVARYTWFGYEGGCEVRKSRLRVVDDDNERAGVSSVDTVVAGEEKRDVEAQAQLQAGGEAKDEVVDKTEVVETERRVT